MDFVTSSADLRVVLEAQRLLIIKCAARFGVDSSYPHAPNNPANGYDQLAARRYGLINKSEAAAYGFEFPPSSRPDDLAKNSPLAWNASPLEATVVEGRKEPDGTVRKDNAGNPLPQGGCAGEADLKVSGGKPFDNTLVVGLLNTVYEQAAHDTRLQAVQAEWAKCMNTKGFRFSQPAEAGNSVKSASKDVQIATAVAYVDCAQTVNLPGVWAAVDTAYQRRAIEENEGMLLGIKSQRDSVIATAKRIVQTGAA